MSFDPAEDETPTWSRVKIAHVYRSLQDVGEERLAEQLRSLEDVGEQHDRAVELSQEYDLEASR